MFKLYRAISLYIFYLFNNPKIITITHGDLRRFGYNEYDNVLLHSMFQVLVDFVEIDCDRSGKRYLLSYLPLIGGILPLTRNPKSGMEYLLQQHEANMTETKDKPHWANTILFLYLWWTKIRPNRKPIEDSVGLDQFYERFPNFSYMEILKTVTKDKREECPGYSEYVAILDKINTLEEDRLKEDDKMMCALVSVRRYLWT